jgi:hypothetical protein
MSNGGKFSEWLHKEFALGAFELTGDPVKDADRFIEQSKTLSIGEENIIRNSAIFRFSFGETLTVHTLTDGVVGKVITARIECIPKKIPKFMQTSFLLDARHDKVLFGNIQSIGGLIINDEMYLIFVTDDGNLYSQTFSKSFDGKKIEDINMMYTYDKNKDPPNTVFMKERKDIFSFALKFALMMEAKRTPLVVDTKNNGNHDGKKSRPKEKPDWVERRIYIDKKLMYKKTGEKRGISEKDNKHLKDTAVRGYIRLQHSGKDLSESEWIYIDDYDSKRWVNPGDIKVTVDLYDK